MTKRQQIGGVIHTYQKYDPKHFPSPTQPPPDLVSPALEHMLRFGSMRNLTKEELARAIKLDPSQIKGLGPSIDMLLAILMERKRKILATYETDMVQETAKRAYRGLGESIKVPKKFRDRFEMGFEEEQIYDLERLWYSLHDDTSDLARDLVQLIERLGDKYQVEELAAKYEFTGRTPMTVPEALKIKEELEKIDELLKQLEEARETAQIAVIDMEALQEFVEEGDIDQLRALGEMVEDLVREMAERQGLENEGGVFKLTPKAYRLFQGRLLERIFSNLQASRSGRHQGPIVGEGAVEMQQTKPYEFGDSLTHMDIPQSFVNAMLRDGAKLPLRLKPEDIEVHRTRNTPKCATVVIMDMSGSMRHEGQYINVKRMALALDGLIRGEYPGDYLNFVEMYTFAKVCRGSQIAELMPKPVTIFDPVVQLKVDMSREDVSEQFIPPSTLR